MVRAVVPPTNKLVQHMIIDPAVVPHFAVIGNPINHSRSPIIHKMFSEQAGIQLSYITIEARIGGFDSTIRYLNSKGFKGCNVTAPFKFDAFNISTHLTEAAMTARAVNTLTFDGDYIRGDNTDGAGLVNDIEHNLIKTLRGKTVLLLGAGGAAWGVAPALLSAGANLHIFNRTPQKAEELCRYLGDTVPVFVERITDLEEKPFDVIINATPFSVTLPPYLFSRNTLAYDLVYGHETEFMKFALSQRATVSDGLGMLVEQAALSFKSWHNIPTVDVKTVLKRCRSQ